jgi:N-acetylglucosaminyldiphosphoundecaprenol N-acetyl-beta-D-mannosaminyltransferase
LPPRRRTAGGSSERFDIRTDPDPTLSVTHRGGDRSVSGGAATPLDLITCATRTELFAGIEARLAAREGFTLATLNLDHIVKMRRDPAFRAAYARQSHVVADGNPVVWLRRLARTPVELVPGSEIVEPIAALAARLDVPVAFLGSRAEVLDRAAAHLEAVHPGLRVVRRIAPPMGYDPDGARAEADLREIAASGAGLCFLALGAPKQERLAARGADIAPGVGFVSVGAGLDFLAGHQRRAPRWIRRLALEWLWRMLSDPRRLAGRYAACALAMPGLTLGALAQRRDGRP